MVKKLLLFILLVSLSSSVLAQQLEKNSITQDTVAVVSEIVASPNPFSVTTKVKFKAHAVFDIEFSVKDLIGNVVHFQKYTTKVGANSIPFYRDKLDSGIYIYSIKTNTEIKSKRIVIK
ncbi:T9SS C-terminal target domain-containing protein [Aureibaculum marinum]|uniref:T9SS C-terminal target domain-containing protein n=1 Tax=Aureibaculum marinum TaxID=2487930 RepID=A0A3N4NPC1_9FLAO|nr:T9SS type A sorting domain-containing protein [Aureibaculum marinum]RPD98212.1 T9SS C-terminal target domain-containing protein [Aureibaculum marinum]